FRRAAACLHLAEKFGEPSFVHGGIVTDRVKQRQLDFEEIRCYCAPFLRSSATMSLWPASSASCNAVLPMRLVSDASAFFFRSAATTSFEPRRAARWRGVSFSLFWPLGVAPAASRTSATSF